MDRVIYCSIYYLKFVKFGLYCTIWTILYVLVTVVSCKSSRFLNAVRIPLPNHHKNGGVFLIFIIDVNNKYWQPYEHLLCKWLSLKIHPIFIENITPRFKFSLLISLPELLKPHLLTVSPAIPFALLKN